MTANERLIIRDYLKRKRWYFAVGFILHLVLMTASWWEGKTVIIGIYGGSAFILMIELQRGGNAVTRTMLSLPVTADQLGRCWRIVALSFPVVLFLIALSLSAVIGAAFRAPFLTAEFYFLIAICQTLFLGISYFALTGIQGQPRTGASIWQRLQDIFFSLIWGGSMPAAVFLSQAIPRHFEDLGRGRIIAGIVMAVATIAGWFRADVLVRERSARPGSEKRKAGYHSATRNAETWKRFGALPYLCLRFGTITLVMLMAMLLINPFALGISISNSATSRTMIKSQVGMFVMFAAFISFFQLLGQLRVLRTMPIRTSALTHWLLFWPLGLAMFLGLLTHAGLSLLDGAPIDWSLLRNSVFGTGFVAILLPLSLRFGMRIWTIMPVMMAASLISSAGPFLLGGYSETHWGWWLAGLVTYLTGVWWSSYRQLGTPHPWRAGAMKWQAMGRRM